MRRLICQIWGMLDPLYLFCTKLECIQHSDGRPAVFRIRLTRYKGRTITLSDGTKICKNDVLVKIHLHNVRLLQEMLGLDEPVNKAFLLYRRVQEALPDLAAYVVQHPQTEQIKGIIGITMLNTGYRRLGFESVTLSSRMYLWFKRLGQYPLYMLFRPESIRLKALPTPHYLFMSKHSMCERYGPTEIA